MIELATHVCESEHAIGIHFFNPVRAIAVTEMVAGSHSGHNPSRMLMPSATNRKAGRALR